MILRYASIVSVSHNNCILDAFIACYVQVWSCCIYCMTCVGELEATVKISGWYAWSLQRGGWGLWICGSLKDYCIREVIHAY